MNNICKKIQNFDVEHSLYMYEKYVTELQKYSKLALIHFILQNYNLNYIKKMLKEYDCIDVLETIQNIYNTIVQFKKTLEYYEGNIIIDKFTFEKCETIINNIINENNLVGGKPFRQFITNLFRSRDIDEQNIDIIYSFVFLLFISTMLSIVINIDGNRIIQLGYIFLVPAFEGILRARRMRNIPEREFGVLYELIFRNTDIHLQRRQIVSFNQYARYYIDGLDLLQWLPTFGNQMITRDFERDNLRRISSELNLYYHLVQEVGWIRLGRSSDYSLDLELAINANLVQLRNRSSQQQIREMPIGEIDYLIIRRASELVNYRPFENCCSICFDNLIESHEQNETRNKNGYLVRLHQQVEGIPHIFHLNCIKNWFNQNINDDCPICRNNIHWTYDLVRVNIPEDENGLDFFDVQLDL